MDSKKNSQNEKNDIQGNEVLEVKDHLILNNQDREVFLSTLANPPAPSENLRHAAKKYPMK